MDREDIGSEDVMRSQGQERLEGDSKDSRVRVRARQRRRGRGRGRLEESEGGIEEQDEEEKVGLMGEPLESSSISSFSSTGTGTGTGIRGSSRPAKAKTIDPNPGIGEVPEASGDHEEEEEDKMDGMNVKEEEHTVMEIDMEVTPEPIDQDQLGKLVGLDRKETMFEPEHQGKAREVSEEKGMDEVKVDKDEQGGLSGMSIGVVVKKEQQDPVGSFERSGGGTSNQQVGIGSDEMTKEQDPGNRKEQEEIGGVVEKVDMNRLLNSIEITKRATFLRQRLSSVGRRPRGETLGTTTSPTRSGPMEGLSNPLSSPPSSPPLRTPGGRIKRDLTLTAASTSTAFATAAAAAGSWRETVGLDSPSMTPASPLNRLYPGLVVGSSSSATRPGPRTPMTPVKKRKLDFMESPFRSPGDLMALTLESPGKTRREGVDVNMDGQDEVKRRGKTWVGVSPVPVKVVSGQEHGRTTSFSAAKVLFSNSNSNDSLVRIGRRASMGTGPRLGFALPRKDRGVVEPVAVEVEAQERAVPRRAMGIEGYLVDRYSDVLGRSKYPPPLPSTAAPEPMARSKPTFEIGHRRRISGSSSSSKPASAVRGHEKYVTFLNVKKSRSSSHSSPAGQRPSGLLPPAGGGPGEVAEAANVLTGMLGGSPLRPSTASPVRRPPSSKMYGRDGEELGFRIPSTRPSGHRPRSESTERRMEMLPSLPSGQVTPPRQISKLPYLRHTDGKPASGDAGGDEDQRAAAELMIFLAQSPGSTASTSRGKRSSVQGAGVGRVLFDQHEEGGVDTDRGLTPDVKVEPGTTAS